ncbi:hypothetical protein ACI2L1_04655 [Streptomyces sp. NPDC019531]|uniref:hypothetical protein n=1 Tax=Streptomyces sp. NPDC019531 TaxID=3365062 RepID=UPI00384E9C58
MRRTTTAVLAVCALALAGCSSSDQEPEKKTVTVTATKTPELSATEQRTACVDAWAAVIQANTDAGPEDTPTECGSVPEDDQLDVYTEGLQQRNEANRAEIDACVADPTCTSVPIP